MVSIEDLDSILVSCGRFKDKCINYHCDCELDVVCSYLLKTILINFLQLNKKIVFSEKGKKSVIINNIQYNSLFQLVKFLFSETKVNLSLVFMYKLKQLCKLFNSKQKAKLSNQAKNMIF